MPSIKQSPKQAAYLFFLRSAGFSYDPKTETEQVGRSKCARQLAKAESNARSLGYRYEWVNDWAVGSHVREYGKEFCPSEPSTCETCLMWAPDGKDIVASLSCIDDATADYRRVVEAELALEVL